MTERNEARGYPRDAIALLKADHHQVHALFATYDRATDGTTKQQIAAQICAALEVHAQLEEHIFYPAYDAQAGKNGTQLVADSRLDHEKVKELVLTLQGLDSTAEEFDATFHTLRQTVQQHVDAEENEMFPEAEQILADQLKDLRDEMLARQQQLMTSPRR
jgi:hemerythrin superfamily protein